MNRGGRVTLTRYGSGETERLSKHSSAGTSAGGSQSAEARPWHWASPVGPRFSAPRWVRWGGRMNAEPFVLTARWLSPPRETGQQLTDIADSKTPARELAMDRQSLRDAERLPSGQAMRPLKKATTAMRPSRGDRPDR